MAASHAGAHTFFCKQTELRYERHRDGWQSRGKIKPLQIHSQLPGVVLCSTAECNFIIALFHKAVHSGICVWIIPSTVSPQAPLNGRTMIPNLNTYLINNLWFRIYCHFDLFVLNRELLTEQQQTNYNNKKTIKILSVQVLILTLRQC